MGADVGEEPTVGSAADGIFMLLSLLLSSLRVKTIARMMPHIMAVIARKISTGLIAAGL